MSISVEPTNICNLHCPECPSGTNDLTRKRGNMSYGMFEKIFNDLKKNIFYLTLYFQGEPYLNKDLFRMIKLAHDNYIFVVTSTNGHFLTQENARLTVESGLDEIIISVDGTDQESYGSYRKSGSLETVKKGISELSRQKKELSSSVPVIVIQFLVLKTNEHQMKEIKKLGIELGADEVRFKTAQFYNFEEGNNLLPLNGKYARYRKVRREDGSERFVIKNPMRNRCWRMWNSAVITWEGDVVPCCYDKNADHKMGNLADSSFGNIWKSENYRMFRQQIFSSRKKVEICRNCNQKW